MELNNKITIGKDYLQKKVRDQYENHEIALVREFLQNSIDAGSQNIEFDFNYGERTLTIVDDGCGMDDSIMVNHLFQLGGSHKENANATGGFGAAKLILFFQHEWFKIVSFRNGKRYEVSGCADSYSDFKVSDEDGKGTTVTIKFMPDYSIKIDYKDNPYDTFSSFEYSAIEYITKCNFTANITWNGKKIEPTLPGTIFKTLDWCKVYFTPLENERTNYVHVRINGLMMFSIFVADMNRQVMIELSYSSLKCLTENRDGLKFTFRKELDALIGTFNKDTESFSRLEGKTFTYQGEKSSFKFLCLKTIKEYKDNLLAKINAKIERCKELNLSDELAILMSNRHNFMENFQDNITDSAEKIADAIESMTLTVSGIEDSIKQRESVQTITANGLNQLIEAMTISAKIMGIQEATETEEEIMGKVDLINASSTKHDIIVKVNKKVNKLNKNLVPSTLSPKYTKLLQLWCHSIRTIADRLNRNVEFKLGWIIDDKTMAMYMSENNGVTFLLNPEINDWWSSESKVNNVKKIFRTACHEFVHYLGNSYHDERFICAYDQMLERMDEVSNWKAFEMDAYDIEL